MHEGKPEKNPTNPVMWRPNEARIINKQTLLVLAKRDSSKEEVCPLQLSQRHPFTACLSLVIYLRSAVVG
jgi:hypothetical protein